MNTKDLINQSKQTEVISIGMNDLDALVDKVSGRKEVLGWVCINQNNIYISYTLLYSYNHEICCIQFI